MDLHQSFRLGAQALATGQYSEIHAEFGISKVDWDLLTQEANWVPHEARAIRAILANVIEVSLTIAGMPPVPLPGQYVAATIAVLVAPLNRLVACQKSPDTFDANAASGLLGDVVIEPMRPEQLMSLVIAYSGGFGGEPMPRLPKDIKEIVKKANAA